jgi:hypothetical protein
MDDTQKINELVKIILQLLPHVDSRMCGQERRSIMDRLDRLLR